jgi:predicted nucleotidyltransferase
LPFAFCLLPSLPLFPVPCSLFPSSQTMTPNTNYLDKCLKEKAAKNEKERQRILKDVQAWLDEFGSEYGVQQAYIFGSLTYPNRFHEESDIDIAVEQADPAGFFSMISFLMTDFNRDVDVIPLNKCHFADKIRKTGVLWTNKNDVS